MIPELQPLYTYALKILSKNDIPERMVLEKIQKKFDTARNTEIDQVITILKQEKFVDDVRFTENFIRWRCDSMPRGKRMMAQELYKKKIPTDLAEQKLEELVTEDVEQKMCSTLATQKFSTFSPDLDPSKKKEKLLRYLLGKGFSFGSALESYEEIISGD